MVEVGEVLGRIFFGVFVVVATLLWFKSWSDSDHQKGGKKKYAVK